MLLFGPSRPTLEVDGNGKNRPSMLESEQRIILKHPIREIPFRPRLDFDVGQYELRRPLVSMDLSHHIGFPYATFRKIREELFAQELERREIEPCRHMRVKDLQIVSLSDVGLFSEGQALTNPPPLRYFLVSQPTTSPFALCQPN